MADKQHRATTGAHVAHLAKAFLLKARIANGEDFVDKQNFALQIGRNSKREPQVHAAGISLYWSIDELFDLSKSDDLVEFALDLGLSHAQDGAVQEDVFPSTEFLVKSRANFQQASNTPVKVNS